MSRQQQRERIEDPLARAALLEGDVDTLERLATEDRKHVERMIARVEAGFQKALTDQRAWFDAEMAELKEEVRDVKRGQVRGILATLTLAAALVATTAGLVVNFVK